MSGTSALLSTLRNGSSSLADFSIFSLRSFLAGLQWTLDGLPDQLCELAGEIPGPVQADVCTRAYLHLGDSRRAFAFVTDLMETRLAFHAAPTPGPRSGLTTIQIVSDAILQGRAAMVLAETTIESLANYAFGHTAGVALCDGKSADAERMTFERFSSFLRDYYGCQSGDWHGIIRIYEGNGEYALRRFIELWQQAI